MEIYTREEIASLENKTKQNKNAVLENMPGRRIDLSKA